MFEDGGLAFYSHCCARTDDRLYVYLPVRLYELTVKHRLLAQLGGFSHLLLDALTLLPERGIGWVLELTDLSLQQLEPILNRMRGLGLMNGKRLSPRGERLSVLKRLLHGQMRHVWLDGCHDSQSFWGDTSLDVEELQEDLFVLRRWHRGNDKPDRWSCRDRNEDCMRQKKRILCHPEQYLSAMFSTFRDCFVETGFNVQEREFDVRYVPDQGKLFVLKVELDPANLRSGTACEFLVASPVLRLDTRYRVPEGAPVELRDLQPKDQHRIKKFGRAAPGTEQLHDTPPSSWTWPKVNEHARQQAVSSLFQEIAVPDAHAEVLFNREHCLTDRWRCLGFDWPTVEASLQQIEALHHIGANA